MTTKILGEQITAYTIDTVQLSNTATAAFAKTLAPKVLYANVASNTFTVLDDTAVNVGGGYIVVTGAEFQSGAQVLIDTTPAAAVTYVNSTTLQVQVPTKAASSYNLYVVNPDGGVGIKVAGITYSSEPTWVTASPLDSPTVNTAFSGNFSANGATSYANTTILPAGFNLLANGYYYGTIPNTTTYSFNIKATDDELQDSTKTFSLTAVNITTIEYLVVAGGGGGGGSSGPGSAGGGGGAGGMLTGQFNITPQTTLTISVGTGGSGAAINGGFAANGVPSSISATGITTITAFGGGRGSGQQPASGPGALGFGDSGGSGGGGASTPGNGYSPNVGGAAGLAIGSPAAGVIGTQGYPGGTTIIGGPVPTNGYAGAGGGGGAGGAGGNTTGSAMPTAGPGGVGGAGNLWPITNVVYAGGGGGGAFFAGGSNGPASPIGGGGGAGGGGSHGTPGLGGGGGGGGYPSNGGNGGSGVVILAVPTSSYPGSAPGATVTTPPAAPGKTVVTFTSSGTYTA
jgi:hypothetical protein